MDYIKANQRKTVGEIQGWFGFVGILIAIILFFIHYESWSFAGIIGAISVLIMVEGRRIVKQAGRIIAEIEAMENPIESVTVPSTPSSPQEITGKVTRYCKFCGNQIDNDALFCDKCGKHL